MVNKADIKRRVMDNQLGPFNKRPELICDLGKDRFISHFGIVNAVYRDHFRVDVALWVDVLVIGAPGKASINHLDGTDLYQSVAIFGVNAGGFRI